MTYVIIAACIDVTDKSCIDVCPVDCIYTDEGSDRMCYIEPNDCIDCAECVAACPVGAIFSDHDLPDGASQFLDINALYFEDKEAARARIEAFMSNDTSVI